MIIRTNFEGIVSILSYLANDFQSRGSGTIIGISSVAGDREEPQITFMDQQKQAFQLSSQALETDLGHMELM